MVVPPSWNVTVPVGEPPPGLFTVIDAVYTIGWPVTDGLADDDRLVVVAAALTFSARGIDELAEKLGVPLYVAVIGWLPTVRRLVVHVAWFAANAAAPQPPLLLPPSA